MTQEHRALVTGASGFIGTNLIHRLKQDGVPVRGIDNLPPRDRRLTDDVVQCDILDDAAFRAQVTAYEPTVIYHLAARTDLDGIAVEDYTANTRGVANLLDIAAAMPHEPLLLMASTRLVFEVGHDPADDYDYRPSTAYGESKIVGEELVRSSGLSRWLIVRPTSIWGPWFDVPYRNFFETIRRNVYMHPRGAATLKSMGYVGNSVHQLIALASSPSASFRAPYWISDYTPYEVAAWAEEIRLAVGARRIRTVPVAVLKAAAHAGDLAGRLGRRAPLTTFRLNNLMSDVVYNTRTTEDVVGPLPFTRSQGVELTAEWLTRT